jgi:hypothetical protein
VAHIYPQSSTFRHQIIYRPFCLRVHLCYSNQNSVQVKNLYVILILGTTSDYSYLDHYKLCNNRKRPGILIFQFATLIKGLGRIHMHAREDMNINIMGCFSKLSGARKMLRVSRPQVVHAKPCDGPHLVLQHSFRDASRGQAPASMPQARKYLITARLN